MDFDPGVLKRFRRAHPKKPTLDTLAAALGINKASYAKKERGDIQVRLDDLQKLAEFYNVKITDFFYSPDDAEIKKRLGGESVEKPSKGKSVRKKPARKEPENPEMEREADILDSREDLERRRTLLYRTGREQMGEYSQESGVGSFSMAESPADYSHPPSGKVVKLYEQIARMSEIMAQLHERTQFLENRALELEQESRYLKAELRKAREATAECRECPVREKCEKPRKR